MTQSDFSGGSESTVPVAAAHLVQFYDEDHFLHDVVGSFLADGLKCGETALVIATEEHCREFATSVAAKGADPSAIRFLDARELMGTLMSDAHFDEERFLSTIAGLVEDAVSGGKRLRAYGELVELLCRDGRRDVAIRVERLWNDLGTLYPFTLLCAYTMRGFQKESDARDFQDVCRAHAAVLPAESYSSTAGADARLREIAVLQQRAAALEAEIGHRRRLELELRQANRMKDEFLATLSHELRTPLTAILGWARMLIRGGMDEATTRLAIETIDRSARAQASLVDDLLDLSRIVTGKLALASAPVNLAVAVDNAVQTLRLAAEARNIRLHVRHTAQPCIVAGDEKRLQQIAWNLLSNAVKFSHTDGSVSVATECDDGKVSLVVRDSGVGIAPEFLPHVFEPFRQADGATTRRHNGLGLGLAIVRYLAESHGGSVTAASPGSGEGSTFTVTLPLAV